MLKKIATFYPLILTLFFLSCSREDPNPIKPPPPVVSIKLNEIYSRGDTTNPDWIELYNPTNSEVDISGYKIYDIGGKGGSKPKKEIPTGTKISPTGFFVIVVDDTSQSGFGLSSSGEQVWLENASGNIIDNVTFPALEVNQSYIRYPDGSANWVKTDSITRGMKNVLKTDFPIKINEIYSNGTANNPDWIEIYNLLDTPIDISGYLIYDINGANGTKPKKTFPAGTTIQGNGFIVIVVDDATNSGFELSSSGEKVWLANAAGMIIDSVLFPALGVDTSYARQPDGSDNWIKLSPVTRGTTNNITMLANVVMNEIYSRGTAANPDWIEIYNPNNIAIDLTGYKIYDIGGQSGTKPKKEFPSGSIIQPNGYYVIVTDDGTPSGFGLAREGEPVWLENQNGVVIDSVTYLYMEVTQSYGRYPDGSPNWQLLNTITRGTANVTTSVYDEKIITHYSLLQNYPNPFN